MDPTDEEMVGRRWCDSDYADVCSLASPPILCACPCHATNQAGDSDVDSCPGVPTRDSRTKMRDLPDVTQVRAFLGEYSDRFTDDDILNAAARLANPLAVANLLRMPLEAPTDGRSDG